MCDFLRYSNTFSKRTVAHVGKPLNKDYKFVELINPIFKKSDRKLEANITVKYLDTVTNMTQLSQYQLILKKTADNWMIESSI